MSLKKKENPSRTKIIIIKAMFFPVVMSHCEIEHGERTFFYYMFGVSKNIMKFMKNQPVLTNKNVLVP